MQIGLIISSSCLFVFLNINFSALNRFNSLYILLQITATGSETTKLVTSAGPLEAVTINDLNNALALEIWSALSKKSKKKPKPCTWQYITNWLGSLDGMEYEEITVRSRFKAVYDEAHGYSKSKRTEAKLENFRQEMFKFPSIKGSRKRPQNETVVPEPMLPKKSKLMADNDRDSKECAAWSICKENTQLVETLATKDILGQLRPFF